MENEQNQLGRNIVGESRPNPDPTLLTTQALFREIGALKELIEEQITATENLTDEKFAAVTIQFSLLEKQRLEQKADTNQAVAAALNAAREAVHEQTASSEKAIIKQENSTKEILNQLNTTYQTGHVAMLRSIDELKERLIAIEQQKVGAKDDRTSLYTTISLLAVVISVTIGIITFILSKK